MFKTDGFLAMLRPSGALCYVILWKLLLSLATLSLVKLSRFAWCSSFELISSMTPTTDCLICIFSRHWSSYCVDIVFFIIQGSEASFGGGRTNDLVSFNSGLAKLNGLELSFAGTSSAVASTFAIGWRHGVCVYSYLPLSSEQPSPGI